MARATPTLFRASFVLPCLLACTAAAVAAADAADAGSSNGTAANATYPTTWVAELFYNALRDFAVAEDVGSSACRQQTHMYRRHLDNGSLWAVQMSDSWSRYPNGILVSSLYHMGVYQECVDVHKPVQGKYCLPKVLLTSATGEDFKTGKPDEPEINDPAWREILGFVDQDYNWHKNIFKFGVCIPESCTAQDLEISLHKEFEKNFLPHKVKAQVKVESILCSTDKDMYPFDTGFYLTSCLIGSILFLCCLSTIYHLIIIVQSSYGEKTNQLPEILNIFSIVRNGRDLIKYDRTNDLNIFNGFKVITMILVLFGHKFLYAMSRPLMYGKRIEMIYKEGPDILLTCMNLVDPFFYIAGYLMYVLMKSQFRKPGTNWCQIPMVIIYKYLKLLPIYVMMMLLTTFIIPHLGNGPLWAWRIWPEADKCKNYWWANMLAISNFIEIDNQCLIASWYISCLLQFIVIGTVVIYVYVKNRKVGTYLIVLLLCASLVINFVMTYVYQAHGIVKVINSFFENVSNSFEFSELYRPFYLRGTPFYAGLLAGIVVDELKKREIKFTPLVVYVGTFVITAICTWVQLYGKVFYELHRPYDILEHSFYSSISHCTWTVILFWVTVCYYTSGYGPIEKILNNRFMAPLGRLSYSVYLVNITVMMMIDGKQKATESASPEFIIDQWILSTYRVYLTAAFLYLTVEAPFGLLIKKLLYGKKNLMENNTKSMITNQVITRNTLEAEQKDSTHL